MNIIPVILSGGSGDRLWPISRSAYPKQFVNLNSDHSLMQDTILRCQAMNLTDIIILANNAHEVLIDKDLKNINCNNAVKIFEPCIRNTAPAIALAAHHAYAQNADNYIWVLPSDQYIDNTDALKEAVNTAHKVAANNNLVTFGIKPSKPSTEYGYIKMLSNSDLVEEFVEKPDLDKAKYYLEQGNYYWNSGMFLFKAEAYLNELKKHEPEIYELTKKSYDNAHTKGNNISVDSSAYEQSKNISIDYAVMERSNKVSCIPLGNIVWSDIGSWNSLWEINDNKDTSNNVTQGNVLTNDAQNNFIHSDNKRIIGAVGVQDLAIIDTKDAVLVCNRSQNGKQIKELVSSIREQKHDAGTQHTKCYRPWGSYEILEESDNFKIKRIIVNPGSILSLQSHNHRSEHWIIVKGQAEVTCDDKIIPLKENESTFIPCQAKHRIANPGTEPMHFIEVQYGSYLGEDDIIRYEDVYGRA